ncbi:MAG: hypothetical protein AABY33_05165 [Pseudomonadota bacterium]
MASFRDLEEEKLLKALPIAEKIGAVIRIIVGDNLDISGIDSQICLINGLRSNGDKL